MNQKQLKKLLSHWDLLIETVQPAIYPNTGDASEFVWEVNHCYLLKAFENQLNLNKNLTLIPSFPQDFSLVQTTDGHDFIEFENQLKESITICRCFSCFTCINR